MTKKTLWVVLLVAAVLAFVLIGCSTSEKTSTPDEASQQTSTSVETSSADTPAENPTTDEETDTRTLTLSASLFEDSDDEEVRSSFEESGCIDVTKNDDGSWTVTMTAEHYNDYVNEMRKSVQESMDGLVDSEDWPNIASVDYDEDFTEVTITLKTDSMTLTDVFAPMAVGVSACLYQEVCELPMDCHIVILGTSGDQLGETTYSAALENMASSSSAE